MNETVHPDRASDVPGSGMRTTVRNNPLTVAAALALGAAMARITR